MIIRFPTGFYDTLLPGEIESGNITYLVSTEDPPRPTIRVLQLPIAAQLENLPPPVFDRFKRKVSNGDLVFTLVRGNRSDPGSNTKQFEVGESLTFVEENLPEVNPLNVPEPVEIRHDTNLLDLSIVGLTNEESILLTKQSEIRKAELEELLTQLKMEANDISSQINENQKNLNEANKILSAAREIFGSTEDNQIIQKIIESKNNFEQERLDLIESLNAKIVEVEEAHEDLLQVSELTR